MAASQRRKGQPETWVPVPIAEFASSYLVSDGGIVVRAKTTLRRAAGSIVRASEDGKGYLQVCLYHAGVGRTVKVHRIVAEAFLGARLPGMTVNHIDGDKKNNDASNLEFVSNLDNTRHACRTLRPNKGVVVDGVRMGLAEAISLYALPGVHYWMAVRRIKRGGWDVMTALRTPPLPAGVSRKNAGMA